MQWCRMHGSKKFCQRGSKFDNVFFFYEGIEDPNVTINGPSLARQQNTIYMVFCGRADDGPTLNAGLAGRFVILRRSRPVLLGNPIFL